MKNSNATIRNRTSNLTACSTVPQPTAPPHTPPPHPVRLSTNISYHALKKWEQENRKYIQINVIDHYARTMVTHRQ
jgi:hypothetical protein